MALNDAAVLLLMLLVRDVELVPYWNPVSVTVPVVNEYEPDRVAPVWLIFITPSVVTVALGSCPPSPPTDGSHLILILPAAIFVDEGFVVYSNLI